MTDHHDHDELLLVRFASGDADELDRAAAEAQRTRCAECAALLADVMAISRATRAADLPAPRRPRSFRLSAEDARRLRPTGPRAWLAAFGTPRFDLVRPLAGVVATIGILVAVLGSLPGIGAGSASLMLSAATEAPERASAEDGGTPGPPPEPGGAYEQSAAPAMAPTPAPGDASATGAPKSGGDEGAAFRALDAEPGGPPWVPTGLLLLGAGAALVGVQTAARRTAGR